MSQTANKRSERPGASACREQVAATTRNHINSGRVAWLQSCGLDLIVGKREACYVWDIGGTRYIDVLCDGTTFNFGHRNPALLASFQRHLESLDIGCQFLLSSTRARLAELLVKHSPSGLNVAHFVPSGSEANDAAIKSAMAATGRSRIVSIGGSFHGVTGLAARATGGSFARVFGMQTSAERWTQVPWNDIESMAATVSEGDVAAVIVETIPATLGWPIPSPGYLRKVRELCTQHGAMLIVDEVQTGLGRCGYLWAIEHWDVQPDIMVMAKGAGGGLYPLAYILMTDEAAEWTRTAPLSMPSTFGGSELGCALGIDVLEMAADPTFLARVNEHASYLADGLESLQQKYPESIAEIRQMGLAAAIRFNEPKAGVGMMTGLVQNKVLAMAAANDLSVIQIKPPLVIDKKGIEELITAIDAAIDACLISRTITHDASAMQGLAS